MNKHYVNERKRVLELKQLAAIEMRNLRETNPTAVFNPTELNHELAITLASRVVDMMERYQVNPDDYEKIGRFISSFLSNVTELEATKKIKKRRIAVP